MQPLITRNDIAQVRQISNTPNDAKLNEMIIDAQMLDLQPLLGEIFFNKLVASPTDYDELLNGGAYELNGQSYINYGLKKVIVYFSYARYMMFGAVTDTPFSTVLKTNENSQPVDASTKKSIYTMNRDSAYQVWENVKNYLVRTQHPDFKHNCQTSAPSRGMKIFKIE